MTPEESTAIATWVAAIGGVAFGLTGLIVGWVSLVRSGKATEAAANANLVAKDANRISKDANSLSSEANDIAREANDLVDAGSLRAVEQHDVTWECRWERPGIYIVRNEGKDTATNVRVVVTVDDETVEATREQVAGGEFVHLKFPSPTNSGSWSSKKTKSKKGRMPGIFLHAHPSAAGSFHPRQGYVANRTWITKRARQVLSRMLARTLGPGRDPLSVPGSGEPHTGYE